MKRKLVSRMLTLLLTSSMLLTAAGCGGTAAESGSVAAAVEEEAAEDAVSDEKTVFDENGVSGKGQLPITKDETTLDVFIESISYISDIEENQTFKTLEERTNLRLDMEIVPEENSKEKLNLLLLGDDYPEVIMGAYILTTTDVITYGTEEQILIPLNDLIDEYCVNLQERWEEMPGLKEAMTSPDGNIYGIPVVDAGGRGHTDVGYKLWINEEWLKNLGLEEPTNTEEFRAVLEAFRDQDPNGNGIKDEIPMTGCTNNWGAHPYYALINCFGYFNQDGVDGAYYMKDGEIQTVYDQDYLREALEYIAGLYADGLIDPASFSQIDTQLQAVGNDPDIERIGVAASGHPGVFMDINNVERASQYEALAPMAGPDGYQSIPYKKDTPVTAFNFAITDKCKNPEAAIKMMDLFCGEEWSLIGNVGEQGVEWDYADEGMVNMYGEPATYKYLESERKATEDRQSYSWSWIFRCVEPAYWDKFAMEGDIRDPLNYAAFLTTETAKFAPYAADVDIMPTLKMDEDTSVQFNTLKTMVDDYVDQAIVEFIVGDRDTETDWDTYLADLKKLGYYDEIQMVKDAVAAQQ